TFVGRDKELIDGRAVNETLGIERRVAKSSPPLPFRILLRSPRFTGRDVEDEPIVLGGPAFH
ncbi:MAG: hypothetical protein OEW83_07450, partial [Acidimicrobiia bacterium]|nr:hypothetical protein [Acidimicrobiia bacterium]